MSRSEEIYKGVTLAAPPLIIWSATQRGWHSAPEIINSNLFTKPQLYAINTLRPSSEFEIKKTSLASVGKYYSVMAALADGPLSAAVENGNAFVWSTRSFDKRESIPTIRLNHYTCHSARTELCVAAYNVAVAMMQLTALSGNNLHDNVNVLRASIQLTGNAERIFWGLMEFANLTSTTEVSPQQPVPAPFANPSHLHFLADWAFAQLCELWFVSYSLQMKTNETVAMGITIVDAYEALGTVLVDQDELNSIVPGFLQRLIAIKKYYYMIHSTLLFMRETDYLNDINIMSSLSAMAQQTLACIDKVPKPVSGISSSIRADVEQIRTAYQLDTYKDNKVEPTVAWEIVKQNCIPIVPGNSIRNSETMAHPSLAVATSIAELHSKIKEALAPRLSLVVEQGVWSLKPDEADAAYLRSYKESLATFLPSVQPVATPITVQSPKQVVIIDPRFETKKYLFERLRRLGTIMTSLATISSIITKLKNSNNNNGAQVYDSRLDIVLQQYYAQLIDYTKVLEHTFFDHSKVDVSADESGSKPYVVNPSDITRLAKAIVSPSGDGIAEIDNATLSKALDDSVTQPHIDIIINLESLLRDEMRPIWVYVKNLESSFLNPSSQ